MKFRGAPSIDRRQFLGRALLIPVLPWAATGQAMDTTLVPVGTGWARNQINAVIFRRDPLATHRGQQYVAYYDADGHVVVGRRRLGTATWVRRRTPLTGDLRDAHNAISLAVDGRGFLHLAWNHHTSPLQYCRSRRSGSLEMSGPLQMTGEGESRVTYPEFYGLPGGDLLFFYRDGASGDGRLMINRYDAASQKWTRLQEGLVSGEGRRNPYWQAAVDHRGTVHLSWVWRETPDVRTNHDLAYAVSHDGGRTWTRSSGETYRLPITAATAEYAARIPQGSDLINQTSMCADGAGRPAIATYWRPSPDSAPQYHVLFHDGSSWHTVQVTRRTLTFTLGGRGTQRIPIARPLVLSRTRHGRSELFVVYRDEERGSRITIARSSDRQRRTWAVEDVTDFPVDHWEPGFDAALWQERGVLHLFLQRVGQGADESLEDVRPQPVYVLEVDL